MKSKRHYILLSLSLLSSISFAVNPTLMAWAAPETQVAQENSGGTSSEAAAESEADGTESAQGVPQDAPAAPAPIEGTGDAAAHPPEIRQNEALDHFDAAQVYIKAWDLELAEVELEAAIMCTPKMKIAHRDYCLVSLFRGHPLRALAEFMMVVGLGEPLPLTDSECAELTKKAIKLHYRKGIAAARASKWDEAINEYKFALSYNSTNGSVLRSLAFAYASKGDFSSAEQQYTAALGSQPDDAFGHADFAVLLADQGQKGRAMHQLEEAVKLAPKATALHVDLGWMAEAGGDWQMAKREFETAVKLAPKQGSLWMHLGKIYTKIVDVPQARNAYARALVLDPTNEDARTALQNLNTQAAPSKPDEDNSDASKPDSSAGKTSEPS